jgi:hypothetical protein
MSSMSVGLELGRLRSPSYDEEQPGAAPYHQMEEQRAPVAPVVMEEVEQVEDPDRIPVAAFQWIAGGLIYSFVMDYFFIEPSTLPHRYLYPMILDLTFAIAAGVSTNQSLNLRRGSLIALALAINTVASFLGGLVMDNSNHVAGGIIVTFGMLAAFGMVVKGNYRDSLRGFRGEGLTLPCIRSIFCCGYERDAP